MISRRTAVRSFTIVVVLAHVPHTVHSQFASTIQLAKVSTIRVSTNISVDDDFDDCAPDLAVLKTEAELVLRRSGIVVVEDDSSRHVFDINLIGLQDQNSRLCVMAYGYQLWRAETLRDGSSGIVESFTSNGVMTGPGYNMQDRLRNQTNQAATALANEILKARQE